MHDDDDDGKFPHKKIVKEDERNYKPIVHFITDHMMDEFRPGEKGVPQPVPYPKDADDFQHVRKFLTKHPDWKKRLGELSLYSERWMILSENWERLEKLCSAQDADTFTDTLRRVMNDSIDARHTLAPPPPAFLTKVKALVEDESGYHKITNLTLGKAIQWGNELARLLERENCTSYKVNVANRDFLLNAGVKRWQSGMNSYRLLPEDFQGCQKGPFFVELAYNRNDIELPEAPERGEEGLAR